MNNIFFTVGTNEISNDAFQSIQDSESILSIKPKGGLWLTTFQKEIPNYNIWADFLRTHPYLLFYKKTKGQISKNNSTYISPFQKESSVVTLKKDASVFVLDNEEKLTYLKEHYPNFNGQFSFVKLSKDYDGIYIALNSLYRVLNYHDTQLFKPFGVDSLLLFRTNPIEYYQKASLEFEPFDYEDYISPADIQYTISVEDQTYQVKPESYKYSFFINELSQIFLQYLEEQKMSLKELTDTHLLENVIYKLLEQHLERLHDTSREITGNLCKKLTQ